MSAVSEALDRLTHHKLAQLHLVNQQLAVLAALRERPTHGIAMAEPDLVAMLYLDMPSAQAVADFCNAEGWRLPGSNKGRRRYKAQGPRLYMPKDVLEIVRSGYGQMDPLLYEMAMAKMEGRPVGAKAPQKRAWG